jgi:ATP-dependent DNA helicase PIF1
MNLHNNQNYSENQQIAFNKFIKGENVFITGPGGSGKSKLIKDIKNYAENQSKNVQVCALTGCASVLLECKAKTLHSWAGIGLGSGPNEEVIRKIIKNAFKKKIWKQIDILIVDEVSMMSKKLFDLLDNIGKQVRKSVKPFGGIQLVFSGDFYQLPPVGNKDEPETIQFCFESEQWYDTFPLENHVQLTVIFRQTDPVYASILNQIREGVIKKSSCKKLEEYVNRPLPKDFRPTKLYPTRNKVDVINQYEMNQLVVESVEYKIRIMLNLPMTEKEQIIRKQYSPEQIETEIKYMQSNLLCENIINIKVGAQVMCIINMDLPDGQMICNGSQGIVTRITENKIPVVKFNNNIEILLNHHIWPSENIPGLGVAQIPLILAWALTIHKAQGATMDCAEIDVGNNIFESGQTYVALSRVKSMDGLYLTSFDASRIRIHKKVKEFYNQLDTNQ